MSQCWGNYRFSVNFIFLISADCMLGDIETKFIINKNVKYLIEYIFVILTDCQNYNHLQLN